MRRLFVLLTIPAFAGAPASLTVIHRGGRFELAGRVPAKLSEVELRIESGRNANISRYTDVSPHTPPAQRERVTRNHGSGREIWYPVVDLRLDPGMEGAAAFSAGPSRCFLNEHFFKAAFHCGQETAIPAGRLLQWENSLTVEPKTAALQAFYLRRRLPVLDGLVRYELEPLALAWSGRFSLHDSEGRLLASSEAVGPPAASLPAPTGDIRSKARLHWSLAATAGYLLRSQNRDPVSPTRGGLHLFYDTAASVYRSSYWIWGWGPEVKLLIETDKLPEVAGRFPGQSLRRLAYDIGEATLLLRVASEDHPARGILISRWDRGTSRETGFAQRISAADAQFLAGWAWMPLYRETRNPAYLEATRELARATRRLVDEFGLPPQDYWAEEGRWSEHTIDESGFGTEGLAELYADTKDPAVRDLLRDYMENHLKRLLRPDGLWQRGWNRTTGVQPANHMTRGMGWAMEGMLAAHRAIPDGKYLGIAKLMADHLMRWQQPDGCWSFFATEAPGEQGISEKGTALWSYLLYQLYGYTGDPRHLSAARRALEWCLRNQYTGPDPEAHGSLIGISPHSAVGYRPYFPVACTYASGFFGLAVIEELRVQWGAPR